MEQDSSDNILAFDTLFTTNHMQILKSLMPYVESDFQKKLAVYIKMSELKYTISYFQHYRAELSGCSMEKKEFDLAKVYHMIKGYCTKNEQRQIEQILNLMNTMETMKNMQEMMEFMKEFEAASGSDGAAAGFGSDSGEFSAASSSDTTGSAQGGGSSMLAMLKGMLPPEQAELFEMLQNT